MERHPANGNKRPFAPRADVYAASPLTRRPALFEQLGDFEAPEPWILVREADGPAYFASAGLLSACEASPLLRATAAAAIKRATAHNEAGRIPAFVTQLESMFLPAEPPWWAAEEQAYVAVCDLESA